MSGQRHKNIVNELSLVESFELLLDSFMVQIVFED
jgi:hypothetical protein